MAFLTYTRKKKKILKSTNIGQEQRQGQVTSLGKSVYMAREERMTRQWLARNV